jgi:hypothetical protein
MTASHLKTEVESKSETKFEVFTAVKIQVEVYWVVTPCSGGSVDV